MSINRIALSLSVAGVLMVLPLFAHADHRSRPFVCADGSEPVANIAGGVDSKWSRIVLEQEGFDPSFDNISLDDWIVIAIQPCKDGSWPESRDPEYISPANPKGHWESMEVHLEVTVGDLVLEDIEGLMRFAPSGHPITADTFYQAGIAGFPFSPHFQGNPDGLIRVRDKSTGSHFSLTKEELVKKLATPDALVKFRVIFPQNTPSGDQRRNPSFYELRDCEGLPLGDCPSVLREARMGGISSWLDHQAYLDPRFYGKEASGTLSLRKTCVPFKGTGVIRNVIISFTDIETRGIGKARADALGMANAILSHSPFKEKASKLSFFVDYLSAPRDTIESLVNGAHDALTLRSRLASELSAITTCPFTHSQTLRIVVTDVPMPEHKVNYGEEDDLARYVFVTPQEALNPSMLLHHVGHAFGLEDENKKVSPHTFSTFTTNCSRNPLADFRDRATGKAYGGMHEGCNNPTTGKAQQGYASSRASLMSLLSLSDVTNLPESYRKYNTVSCGFVLGWLESFVSYSPKRSIAAPHYEACSTMDVINDYGQVNGVCMQVGGPEKAQTSVVFIPEAAWGADRETLMREGKKLHDSLQSSGYLSETIATPIKDIAFFVDVVTPIAYTPSLTFKEIQKQSSCNPNNVDMYLLVSAKKHADVFRQFSSLYGAPYYPHLLTPFLSVERTVGLQARLSWDAREQAGMHGFHIYRRLGESPKPWVKIADADLKARTFLDQNPQKGQLNYYSISSFNTDDESSRSADTRKTYVDITPPSLPTLALKVFMVYENEPEFAREIPHVEVTWMRVKDDDDNYGDRSYDAAGFRLDQYDGARKKPKRLGNITRGNNFNVNLNQYRFTDGPFKKEGGKYCYSIQSYDRSQNFSEISPKTCIDVPPQKVSSKMKTSLRAQSVKFIKKLFSREEKNVEHVSGNTATENAPVQFLPQGYESSGGRSSSYTPSPDTPASTEQPNLPSDVPVQPTKTLCSKWVVDENDPFRLEHQVTYECEAGGER